MPADAISGCIPGAVPDGVQPLFGFPELVAHMDYCPGNVVFRVGVPVVLIDFDLARPTTRVPRAEAWLDTNADRPANAIQI